MIFPEWFNRLTQNERYPDDAREVSYKITISNINKQMEIELHARYLTKKVMLRDNMDEGLAMFLTVKFDKKEHNHQTFFKCKDIPDNFIEALDEFDCQELNSNVLYMFGDAIIDMNIIVNCVKGKLKSNWHIAAFHPKTCIFYHSKLTENVYKIENRDGITLSDIINEICYHKFN